MLRRCGRTGVMILRIRYLVSFLPLRTSTHLTPLARLDSKCGDGLARRARGPKQHTERLRGSRPRLLDLHHRHATHDRGLAVQALGSGWNADVLFETKHGPLLNFVAERGWPVFREAETTLHNELITSAQFGVKRVLSPGGGIVETHAALELLKAYKGPIVPVTRSATAIVESLKRDKARPAYDKSI